MTVHRADLSHASKKFVTGTVRYLTDQKVIVLYERISVTHGLLYL